jgi:hypothetical protein
VGTTRGYQTGEPSACMDRVPRCLAFLGFDCACQLGELHVQCRDDPAHGVPARDGSGCFDASEGADRYARVEGQRLLCHATGFAESFERGGQSRIGGGGERGITGNIAPGRYLSQAIDSQWLTPGGTLAAHR